MRNERAVTAFRRGDFGAAYQALIDGPANSDVDTVLRVELLSYIGKCDEASQTATYLLHGDRLPKLLQSRCTSVLADDRWHSGETTSALKLYRRTVQLAEDSDDLDYLCRCRAQLLERTCDSAGFDSSVPLATAVRRQALRSSDIQLRGQAHLTFGRL